VIKNYIRNDGPGKYGREAVPRPEYAGPYRGPEQLPQDGYQQDGDQQDREIIIRRQRYMDDALANQYQLNQDYQ